MSGRANRRRLSAAWFGAILLLGLAAAGGTAPRQVSPISIQRLRAAEAALARAYRARDEHPGKAGVIQADRALAAYNLAREAVYGKLLESNALEGSFDGSIAESEPNQTAAAAQSLDTVLTRAGTAVVVGEIRAAGDQDYFSFSAEAGTRVWAYVDTGGPQFPGSISRDPLLTLLDTNQTTVIETDDDDGTGNGRDEVVETGACSVIAGRVLPSTGTFYLKVTEYSGNRILAPYRLYVVLTSPATATGESETNDTPANADTLLPVAARSGVVSGTAAGADVDLYRVALQAGDVLTLQLDEDPGRDGANSNAELALLDPVTGTPLIAVSGLINSGGHSGQAFSWRATAPGIYFAGVRQMDVAPASDYALLAAVHTRTTGEATLIHGTLGDGSLDYPSVSGTQVGQLHRNGVPSNCATAPKAFPGTTDGTNPHAFDAYAFKNRSGQEACVTVAFTAYDFAEMHSALYSTFDPGDLQPGYLGDSGVSANGAATRSYSVKVAPGAVFVIVISDVFLNGAAGQPYTLSVTGDFHSSLVGGPADMTVPNDLNQVGAVVNYNPPFPSDPSLGPVVCTPPPGSFFPLGTTQVTCRDQGGSTYTFNITVRDVQPPTLNAPAVVNAAQTQAGGALVNYTANATDNAPGVGLVCTPASGSFFPLGATLVNCVATDAAGNVTTKAFPVNVTVPASTAGVRIAASGSIATGTPAATFKATGSVSAAGVPKLTVTYTQKTAGQALKATAITAVTRNGNTVRIFGKMKNGTQKAVLDFMLELVDNGKTRPPSDTVRLDVRNGFQLATTVIKTGDISIKP